MAYLSPGVYYRERDLSIYAAEIATTVFGVVGAANKGPVNKPTLVTSQRDLILKFGKPISTDFALYAALQYLNYGNKCYFVRVTDGTDVAAGAEVIRVYDSAVVLTLSAASTGVWGNSISYKFEEDAGGNKNFNLYVDNELYESYTLEDDWNEATSKYYILNVVNNASELIEITEVASDIMWDDIVNLTGTFIGGIDGSAPVEDDIMTALDVFANPEELDVNMIAAPGYTDGSVAAKLISVATTRADCLALLDPPVALDPADVIDYHNGEGAYEGLHSAFNSSYAALYWPWLQVYDPYYDRKVWMPPSGFVAGVFAYNDKVGEIFNAPAGLNRGKVLEPLQTEYVPNQSERDVLYSGGNCINIIMNFPRDGIAVWGNKTLQRKPSWLQKLNVRRMMLYIEKIIATSSRYYVFDMNNPNTWKAWKRTVTPLVNSLFLKGGIEAFSIIMDETTVSALDKMNDRMPGEIHVIPTGVAEKIVVTFALHSAGTTFGE